MTPRKPDRGTLEDGTQEHGLVIHDLVDLQTILDGTLALLTADPIDYGHDPQRWLTEVLGEYAWSVQREIWESVHSCNATAVLSCNNSGKTWLAARLVAHWMATYWRDKVRVVTTAPTAAQVSLLLWQEIRGAYEKAKANGRPLPGRIIGSPFPQWKIGQDTLAFGRKPADHERSAFQGVHGNHVLIVLDEAGGVAQQIWDAVKKISTTGHVSVLAIGNPDDPNSPFAKVAAADSDWNVIRIDGLRTPNFTAAELAGLPLTRALMEHESIPYSTEDIPAYMRPSMLRPSWVEDEIVRTCGVPRDLADRLPWDEVKLYVAAACEQSQLFTAMVRGEFPDGGAESVIPLGWVRRAVERWKDWQLTTVAARASGHEEPGRRVVGVDVATENGADETAIAPRQGRVVYAIHRYPKGDTIATAQHAIEKMAGVSLALAVVDVIGIGAGVVDQLRAAGIATVSFNAAAQSDRTDKWGNFRFANDRAAAWWHLRELLDPANGADLCLPDDDRLLEELTAPKWEVRTAAGVPIIKIEAKDDIRKRLKHSTDSADAVVQACWVDGAPPQSGGQQTVPWSDMGKRGQAVTTGGGAIAYEIGEDDEDGGW